MAPFPMNMIRVNEDPPATTDGSAPINRKRSGAKSPPMTAMGIATKTPSPMACTAAAAASRGCFSPIRRATMAVAPIPKPMPSA